MEASLKHQIKQWEREFLRVNNRKPSSSDVRKEQHIAEMYKEYQTLRLARKSEQERKPTEKTNAHHTNHNVNSRTKPKSNESIEDTKSKENNTEPKEHNSPLANAELGPTPQAFGKVLLIFDYRMTPPDSSPVKTSAPVDVFRTPTKLKKISGSPLKSMASNAIDSPKPEAEFKTPKSTKNVMARLSELASPKKLVKTVAAQLQELAGKDKGMEGYNIKEETHKVEVHKEEAQDVAAHQLEVRHLNGQLSITQLMTGLISPKKPQLQAFSMSPSKNRTLPATPNKSGMNEFTAGTPQYLSVTFESFPKKDQTTPVKQTSMPFLVSPSPLKPHRFLTRKLTDVFNEAQSIEPLDEEFAFNEEVEEEVEDEAERPLKKKKYTQKRTTRRWKIKPRMGPEEDDDLQTKNVHAEIAKIAKSKEDEFDSYMKSEGEELESESDDDVYKREVPKNTKGMRAPISNNFQRSRINDPRAKAFKRRMRR